MVGRPLSDSWRTNTSSWPAVVTPPRTERWSRVGPSRLTGVGPLVLLCQLSQSLPYFGLTPISFLECVSRLRLSEFAIRNDERLQMVPNQCRFSSSKLKNSEFSDRTTLTVLLPSMSLSLHPSPSPDRPGLRRGPDERRAGPGARSSRPNRRGDGRGKVVQVAGSVPKAGRPRGRAAGPPSRRGRVRGPKPGRRGERFPTSQKILSS